MPEIETIETNPSQCTDCGADNLQSFQCSNCGSFAVEPRGED